MYGLSLAVHCPALISAYTRPALFAIPVNAYWRPGRIRHGTVGGTLAVDFEIPVVRRQTIPSMSKQGEALHNSERRATEKCAIVRMLRMCGNVTLNHPCANLPARVIVHAATQSPARAMSKQLVSRHAHLSFTGRCASFFHHAQKPRYSLEIPGKNSCCQAASDMR